MASLQRSIRSLARRSRHTGEGLGAAPAPVAIPASRASGLPSAAGSDSDGSGVASPLTQTDSGDQVLSVTSSDGFFVFEYPQRVTYTDAAGVDLVFVRA